MTGALVLTMSPGIKTTIDWIYQIYNYAWAVPALFGLWKWRKSNVGFKALTVMVFVGFTAETIMRIYKDTNVFSLLTPRVYTVIEFGLIVAFFVSITSRKNIRYVMYFLSVLLIPIAIYDYLAEGLKERDDLTVGVESLILVGYSLTTLYNILRDGEYQNITSTPQFWAISGVLIYFGANVFVFISSNYIRSISIEASLFLWAVHAVINSVFYFILAFALWKVKVSQ